MSVAPFGAVSLSSFQMPVPLVQFQRGSAAMLDIVLLVIGLGFFVLSVAYGYACDRL